MAGIMFQDITTLLLDPKAFNDTIDLFVERYKGKNISVVAVELKKITYLLVKKEFIFGGVTILIKSLLGELLYYCDYLEGGGVHCFRESRPG